jgi:hypothetical protein
MLDGFLGYNQILVKEEYKIKTTFTRPWGMYKYLRIPFGIMNSRSTVQRAMHCAFKDLIGNIIEIYQDDLMVLSKDRKDHACHLKQIFDIFISFGISLNPKKSMFDVDEGNFLENIISNEGVKIDLARVEYF